jgi:hypothetical protein
MLLTICRGAHLSPARKHLDPDCALFLVSPPERGGHPAKLFSKILSADGTVRSGIRQAHRPSGKFPDR